MSYCLNPVCPQPQNIDKDQFCQTCGSKLLLRERYRAIKPIGKGGFGKTFLAVDCDKPSKPPCVIKQFSPDLKNTKELVFVIIKPILTVLIMSDFRLSQQHI